MQALIGTDISVDVNEEFMRAMERAMRRTFASQALSTTASQFTGIPESFYEPAEKATLPLLLKIGYMADGTGKYRLTERGLQRYRDQVQPDRCYGSEARKLVKQVIYLTTTN